MEQVRVYRVQLIGQDRVPNVGTCGFIDSIPLSISARPQKERAGLITTALQCPLFDRIAMVSANVEPVLHQTRQREAIEPCKFVIHAVSDVAMRPVHVVVRMTLCKLFALHVHVAERIRSTMYKSEQITYALLHKVDDACDSGHCCAVDARIIVAVDLIRVVGSCKRILECGF